MPHHESDRRSPRMERIHEHGREIGEFSGERGIDNMILTGRGYAGGRMNDEERKIMFEGFVSTATWKSLRDSHAVVDGDGDETSLANSHRAAYLAKEKELKVALINKDRAKELVANTRLLRATAGRRFLSEVKD